MSKEKDADKELRKQAIWDAMSPRRRAYIEKIGYDRWDPFQDPKDPIDIRKDPTKRTTQMLVREFLQTRPGEAQSTAYGRGVMEICHGLINDDDRCRAMFEFSCWYRELLVREGHLSEKDTEEGKNSKK